MRPLDTPHLEVVAVGLGPIAAHACRSPEAMADALPDFLGRDSQALRRDSAGIESKG
jgi:hypothetical protein